jgi:UDP-N-acetylglucosamine 2-epimerase (non-hydrolysing)
LRIIVLTTHRRENFGEAMRVTMQVLGDFVASHPDTALVFPVHPNPAVMAECRKSLREGPRLRLVAPMNYPDFLHLLNASWLIASDSGGIQEEAPSLGKPLLVLRQETERPEVVACGAAQLVGDKPEKLMQMLEESYRKGSWVEKVRKARNPFGRGDAAQLIVAAIDEIRGGNFGPYDRIVCAGLCWVSIF